MGLVFARRRKPGPTRLCHVTTTDESLGVLFSGQHRYFIEQGYEVWGAAAPDTGKFALAEAEGLKYVPVKMSRRFGVFQDLLALVKLYQLFRRVDFDIVEAGTIKGGFLGMLAARLAGVPLRIYTFRGASYVLSHGFIHWAIKTMVRCACRSAHQVLPICHELRQRCQDDRLCDINKARVILSGSSNGVNLERFTLTDDLRDEGRRIRRQAGIPDDAVVVGIVARLKIEKGICELVEAFTSLQERWPALWLMAVGNLETMLDPVPDEVERLIRTHPRIHFAGYQNRTEAYYAAMDILAHPSHREGFGNVIIEASAMELPVITCDTMGCREAAADGESGILVPVGDTSALVCAIERLLVDQRLRKRLGQQGRKRVEELFDQRKLWPVLGFTYREYLKAHDLPLPQVMPAAGPDLGSLG